VEAVSEGDVTGAEVAMTTHMRTAAHRLWKET
jgi:DNA-binding FadR family transcriptional regulator